MNIKKLVLLSLLVSQALVFSIVESMLPNIVPIAGVKLGLANIVSVIAMDIFGFKESVVILILRVILSSIFTGGMSTFIYSITGGLLSIIVMNLMYKFKNNFSIISISVVGAVFHNIGQLLVASIIIENTKIFYYLPILMISAVITGIIIGLTAKYSINLLNNYILHKWSK